MTSRKHDTARRLAVGLALTTALTVSAQTDSTAGKRVETERATMFAVGHTDILDTYLSQEKFSGTEFRYVSQYVRHREGTRLMRETTHQILVSSTGTRSNNNALLTAMYRFMLGWYYLPEVSDRHFRMAMGALADGALGGA